MPIIPGILASGITGSKLANFDSIATVTGTGSATTLSFTSIPSTYKHLQIRGIGRNATTLDVIDVRFNSDTGANYSVHRLYGTGTAASVEAVTSITRVFLGFSPSTTSVIYGTIMDILDYANTNKYKTTRTLGGYDTNGGGEITLASGLWMNTSAINRIDIVARNGNAFSTSSTFALYGIKA